MSHILFCFFFQAEDGIRDLVRSRGLGDVYKRQVRHGKDRRVITDLPAGGAAGGAVMVDAYDPTVFIFDAYPGGIGFSDLLFAEHGRLLASAKRLLRTCPCSHGCPSCVGPTLEVGPAAKQVALDILGVLKIES